MDLALRQLPEPAFAAIAVVMQWVLCGRIRKALESGAHHWVRNLVGGWRWIGSVWLMVPLLQLDPVRAWRLSQIPWLTWLRGLALLWGVCVVAVFAMFVLYRATPAFRPSRRRFLGVARTAAVAAPFAVAGFGVVVGRDSIGLSEVDLAVPNLPRDLDGLRIAQLSDIHLSPFLDVRELDRAIDIANQTRPHLAVVTGDLITVRDHLLGECLQRLRRLRAEAGVLGCLGNHEIVARCEARAKQEGAALGLDFLRGEKRILRFGDATLNVAGVDFQHSDQPYLAEAGALLQPAAVNLLLSHNPDVFDVAADQGWDVTLAGHTHGGQVTVELLQQYVNPARHLTPYVYGLYRKESSAIYVNRGLGTVGVPARIGASPEVALIRLCAT